MLTPHVAWVTHPGTIPELLFIRRSHSSSPPSSHGRWSSHIAFPGGRHEPSDESALYTALRETWEEIGVDLAERDFVQVGRLDEREITTSLGKRLLMILSPFGGSSGTMRLADSESRVSVPTDFTFQPDTRTSSSTCFWASGLAHKLTASQAEVSSVHWIPLSSLTPPFALTRWSQIEIDISTRLSPRNKLVRWALRGLVGKMQ